MFIRTANSADIEEAVRVENLIFPGDITAARAMITERIKTYPEHFWLLIDEADEGEKLIGMIDGMVTDLPDLEGCNTYGETLEETLDLASEALGLYLVSLSEAGTPLPEASDLSEMSCRDGHAIYVTTDINKYRRDTKAVKKMLSIPAWLAKEAEARNLSLSKVLQEALQERLHMV